MSDCFFALSADDQREALEQVRAKTDRPTHLLEKDVWVVWTLAALFGSPLATDVTFKGGTSLSKAYKIIDRFSEDIDLTYDMRKLLGTLVGDSNPIPANRSQASKWTKAVRDQLPAWITANVQPVIEAALAHDQIEAKLEIGGDLNDKLLLHYPALKHGTGYVPPVVTMEFGGRGTSKPHQVMPIVCDMDGHLSDVSFPTASPVVMSVARTFWEKATAAHVYCAQGRIRSERFARHWHDLAAIGRSPYFPAASADRAVAENVAQHKSFFFIEKDANDVVVNYMTAVTGHLNIVPQGEAREALAADYSKMLADDVMIGQALPFDQLMDACGDIEARANEAAAK